MHSCMVWYPSYSSLHSSSCNFLNSVTLGQQWNCFFFDVLFARSSDVLLQACWAFIGRNLLSSTVEKVHDANAIALATCDAMPALRSPHLAHTGQSHPPPPPPLYKDDAPFVSISLRFPLPPSLSHHAFWRASIQAQTLTPNGPLPARARPNPKPLPAPRFPA
jgi:hypothetical protein